MIPTAALALALSVQPSPMRLREDARATVRAECAAQPSIAASIGRIDRLRRTGESSWEADYLPPDEELPQVALLTALCAGEAAFAAVPLWAEGDAVLKTRPGGRISVDIGERTFGPVIADERGEAVVPVVVPPGVREARHGKRKISLGVPESRTIHVAFGEAARSADRAQTVPVYIVAVTPTGDPRSGAAIRLRASRGTLGAVRELKPGLYQTSLALAPAAPGTVRITAALEDAPRFLAVASLHLGGGAATTLKLTADREQVSAQDPHATLRASARDAAGNAPGDEIHFETSAGEVRTSVTGPGEWTLNLTLPSSFAGLTSVEIRARAAGAQSSKTLRLVPGPAEVVVFKDAPAAIVADGTSPVRVGIELRDRYGNTVSGIRPQVSAEEGQAEVEEHEGTLYASYVPPLRRERGATLLSARAGPAVGSARLTLLPALKPLALSAKAGFLSNFSGFSAPLMGVEAALRTDSLGPQLAFSIEADYLHRAQSDLISSGAPQMAARSRLDLLMMHASAAYRRSLGNGNVIWVAAGPSAGAYWSSLKVGDASSQRGFAIAPGLHAGVGAERRVNQWVPFVETRAAWLTSPGLPTLSGPLRTFSLIAGVRFETR